MTADFFLGQIIAKQFRVDALISSGGMGSVFRVWDLERSVALAMKVLHADLAKDKEMLEHFKREARALRKLEHPNIVPFYGMYQTPSNNFLLQLNIDGPTLKDVLVQRSGTFLPTQDTLCVMKSLCSAVGYVHSNNVVHCDIKPANVMIDGGGKVYLGDFGIARHAESDLTLLPGAGTPAYLAPEQITSNTVTKETDIYALGVLLFELLTGRRPFTGTESGIDKLGSKTNNRIRYAQIYLPPPDPRQFNPCISPHLAAVILRALEKDPPRRYSSCQELLFSLSSTYGVTVDQISDRISSESLKQDSARSAITDELQKQPIPYTNDRRPVLVKQRPNTMLFMIGGIAVILVVMFLLFSNKDSSSPTGLSIPPITGNSTTAPVLLLQTEIPLSTPIPGTTPLPLSTPTVRSIDPMQVPPTQTQVPPTLTQAPPTITVEAISDFPMYYPDSKCPGSHLRVGDSAYLPYGEGKVSMRTDPVGKIGDSLYRKLEEGEVVHIIGGPVCDLGLLLWEVRTVQNEFGWLPEGDNIDFWILPVKTKQVCTGLKPTRLWIGATAYVEPMPKDRNILFSKPTSDAKELGRMDPGSFMQVLDGPRCVYAGLWWYVYSEQLEIRGWTRETGSVGTYYFIAPVIPRP